MPDAEGVTLEPHSSCVCPTPIKGLGWVGGWVGGCQPPPPPGGGGTFVGLWVPPPPLGWLSKTLSAMRAHLGGVWRPPHKLLQLVNPEARCLH